MEEITPELERRLQVEEAWARRTVLSDMMNERRLAAYGTRRMLLRFHTADFSADAIAAPAKTLQPQSDSAALKNIVPARLSPEDWNAEPKAPGRMMYWTGAIAATVAILLGTAALSGQISWPDLVAAYSPHTLVEEEGPAPADVLAKAAPDLSSAARTEPSAPVESDDRAEQSTLPQASGVERPDLREEVRLRIEAAQQTADRTGEQQIQPASEAAGASAGR